MNLDWDAEARRGTLTLFTEESPTSVGVCVTEAVLTEDELIELYRVIRAEIGGYVEEMDSYAAEFARSRTVGGWSPETVIGHDLVRGDEVGDEPHVLADALADRADHDRKVAKGE